MPPHPLDDLAEYFATLLRVPRSSIPVTANVLDLGADSIMLLEARGWIESRYGRRIEIRQFFKELDTIEAIAAFLAETQAEAGVPPPAPRPSAVGGARDALAGSVSADIALMRAQLAMVAEVIEAQNRHAGTLRGRIGAPRPSEPSRAAGRAGHGAEPLRPAEAAAMRTTEVTPA